MGRLEILALSLGLSLAFSAASYGLMKLFEGRDPDPVLRERGWALALYIPVLPIFVAQAALFWPMPGEMTGMIRPQEPVFSAIGEFIIPAAGTAGPRLDWLAVTVVALAGLLSLARAVRLVAAVLELKGVLRSSQAAPTPVLDAVKQIAFQMAAPAPSVRTGNQGTEALIAGLRRPVLVLPARLVAEPGSPALRAVCAHELAHLRRGDHRTLWIEELWLVLMAFNPLLGLIRAQRAAAREEVCDAEALRHAGEGERRLYAQALLDAFRAAASKGGLSPTLTFTSSRRILVMRRLKAILFPVPASGGRHRLTLIAAGVALGVVAGTTSVALASQRSPDPQTKAQPAVVVIPGSQPNVLPAASALPAPTASPRATVVPASVSKSRSLPVARPAQAPAPITNPSWVESPRPSWPEAASAMGVTVGKATVSCVAGVDGRLNDCSVVSENPAGAGFGPEALKAAERARLSPRTVDEGGVGRTIQFGISFRLAE